MPTPTPAADGAHDRSPRAPRPTRPDPSIPPTAPTGPGALLGGRRVRLLPAILALALGSFAIGTTEFAMMGLLPQAVADLGIGLEAGGVLISMYALGVVIGAPLLAASFARVDRRVTSIVLMLLFVTYQLWWTNVRAHAQADQAAMQEKNAEAMDSMNELKPDDSTPTMDSVRAKIEKRYADALGAQELHQASGGDRIQEIAAAGHDMRATSRLDEIRAEMAGEAKNKELEAGEDDK